MAEVAYLLCVLHASAVCPRHERVSAEKIRDLRQVHYNVEMTIRSVVRSLAVLGLGIRVRSTR